MGHKQMTKSGISSCCAQLSVAAPLSVLAPLVLSGAAPDTGIAALQCPPQTRSAHRARSAYLLGFVDLKQGGTRGAEGKKQVGIHVATGGVVTPVRALGVPSPLEKVLARVTHRATPPFLLVGLHAAALACHALAIQVFPAAGRLPLLRTSIFAPC
jgi:hypothetical protein